MWRWSALVIVPIVYVAVDRMLKHYIIAGTSTMGDLALGYAPLAAGFIMLGLILATLFR